MTKVLTTKTRLIFKRTEIQQLHDHEVIEFQISANANQFKSDPREIRGLFRCTVRDVKSFFNWNTDLDWHRGQHSWSRFPNWALQYFQGRING